MYSFSKRKIYNSINLHDLKCHVCFQYMNLTHKVLSVKCVCLIIFGVIILCTVVQYYLYTLYGDFHPKTSKFLLWGKKHLDSMMVILLFTTNSTQDGMCYLWHEEFGWKFRENKMSSYFSDQRENPCGKESKQSSKYVFIISVRLVGTLCQWSHSFSSQCGSFISNWFP